MSRRSDKYLKLIVQMAIDCLIFNLSYYIAYMLRFDFDMQSVGFVKYFGSYIDYFWMYTVIKLAIFIALRVYRTLWQYANHKELIKLIGICLVANLACLASAIILQIQPQIPRTVLIITFIVDCALIGATKLSYRYFVSRNDREKIIDSKKLLGHKKRIMIVGAGSAAALLIRDMEGDIGSKVVLLVDDDKSKLKASISGKRVLGEASDIPRLVSEYSIDEIVIAIPSATSTQIKRILSYTNELAVKVRLLPSLKDLVKGKVSVKELRDVDLSDLLGREEVNLDLALVSTYLAGKVVMVTGGGGSIGSELCRQIAKVGPSKLIIIDIYENSAFELLNELERTNSELKITVSIVSIRDSLLMRKVFEQHRPQVVFHAAAHKHVPLMEDNANEAVVNNILGTCVLINLCSEFAVEKCVMISTDKAVNPKNVMGATKRIAEQLVQQKNLDSSTKFVAVRFGNVLGSNGSVIPIFKKQIEAGGPITITDESITRYFMTIPEAASLVVQAGALASGGEIYILDMGEPVKILDLALNMIRLSGKQPYEDIGIKVVGLRPGEKLFEELSYNTEETGRTDMKKIFVARQQSISNAITKLADELLDPSAFEQKIGDMTPDEVRSWLSVILPEYSEYKRI